MSGTKPIGLFGGAFDPVHLGHLQAARGCLEALALQEVCFIPTGVPAHKPGIEAPPEHRLAMLELALADEPRLRIEDAELSRAGRSYTIDTLMALRAGHARQPLCFIMGTDTFAALSVWRRWQELTDYAHLALVERRQTRPPRPDAQVQAFYRARACTSPAALHSQPGGCIYKTSLLLPDISSTQVRALAREGRDVTGLLPPGVGRYIRTRRLYSCAR